MRGWEFASYCLLTRYLAPRYAFILSNVTFLSIGRGSVRIETHGAYILA